MLHLLGTDYTFCDGEDVWPLATGERESVRDHVVTGWAGWSDGRASGRASVRDDEWNYVVAVDAEDPNAELYHLPSDPDEEENVIVHHPDVVKRQRTRLEAVIGQPLPATLNEVCDRAAPVPRHLYRVSKHSQK
jgi:hypothetical protein